MKNYISKKKASDYKTPNIIFVKYSYDIIMMSLFKDNDLINDNDGIDKNLLRPFLTLDRITQSPLKCIDCEVASGCAWCQGENYDAAETSTIYQRSTAICKMHKARVRANNYYWNKLFQKLDHEGKKEQFEALKNKTTQDPC